MFSELLRKVIFTYNLVCSVGSGIKFHSGIFQQVLHELGIIQYKSSPYHPESQGAPERFHQTLINMIRSYCFDTEKIGMKSASLAISAKFLNILGFKSTYSSLLHYSKNWTPAIKSHTSFPLLPSLTICLFVFRFYGPVNPMGSCRSLLENLFRNLLVSAYLSWYLAKLCVDFETFEREISFK